jgi:hypothetical protein
MAVQAKTISRKDFRGEKVLGDSRLATKKRGEPLSFFSKHMDHSHSSYLHQLRLIETAGMEPRHTFHNKPFVRMASNRY